MKFCYIYPGSDSHVVATNANLDDRLWVSWMHSMVEDSFPGVIFFFTSETTDIW